MLASCTTSRCAAWDTIGSDDREMMWSHTSDRVLHWKKGIIGEKAAASRCVYHSPIAFAPVEQNSPHAEFCFPFRTQSSPAGWQSVLNWLLLAFLLEVEISLAPITPNTPTQTCTTKCKHQTNKSLMRRQISLSLFAIPASLSLSSILSLTFFTPTFHFCNLHLHPHLLIFFSREAVMKGIAFILLCWLFRGVIKAETDNFWGKGKALKSNPISPWWDPYLSFSSTRLGVI